MDVMNNLVDRARNRRWDILAAGAALVDVLERVVEDQPGKLGLRKGFMNLVDRAEARRIYATMGETHAASGGSAANTASTLGQLGRRVAFAGKTANDQFGEIFAHDLRVSGVEFLTAPIPHTDHADTGRSLILVTPDSERTMCTELGASRLFGYDDVASIDLAKFGLLYLESYLLDDDHNRQAFAQLVANARTCGTGIALSLSDPGCVERHGDYLRSLLKDKVEILFGNEDEMLRLARVDSYSAAVANLQRNATVVALTRGANGIAVAMETEIRDISPFAVTNLVDTTGAGDMFAAGFLYGVLNEHSVWTAARIGAFIAAEVLSHLGARPEANLQAVLAARDWANP